MNHVSRHVVDRKPAFFLAPLFVSLCVLNMPAWAESRTVTLSVPGMTCAACPVTIKMALRKVDGVQKAEASLEAREFVVVFDDEKTSVRALIEASSNAGYSASIKAEEQ